MRALKRLDVYPKTLEDFREQTTTGAVVSVITLLFVVWLFVSEVSLFVAHEVDPELFVDTERSDKIRINLDVYFPSMPCSAFSPSTPWTRPASSSSTSPTTSSKSGSAKASPSEWSANTSHREATLLPPPPPLLPLLPLLLLPRHHYLLLLPLLLPPFLLPLPAVAVATAPRRGRSSAATRARRCARRIASEDGPLPTRTEFRSATARGFQRASPRRVGEGCQVYGYLLVNKVAGNFHFSPGKSFQSGGAHVHDYGLFHQSYFNLSHTINSLSFGVQFPGVVNPLDKVNFVLFLFFIFSYIS